MPEKRQSSNSGCNASIAPPAPHAYSLKEAGDFIERVKSLGATAVVVGAVSVRFPDALPPRSKAKEMSAQQIAEWSA